MARKLFSLDEMMGAFDDVRAAMDGDSDLACAVLGAAYVEKLLGILLRHSFVESPRRIKEMFASGAVLENCGAQNDIAWATGLISEEMHDNIAKINKIRNEFAHSHVKVTFKTETIANMCRSLGFYLTGSEKAAFDREFKAVPEKLFRICVGLTSGYLGERAKRAKHPTHTWAAVDRALGRRVRQASAKLFEPHAR